MVLTPHLLTSPPHPLLLRSIPAQDLTPGPHYLSHFTFSLLSNCYRHTGFSPWSQIRVRKQTFIIIPILPVGKWGHRKCEDLSKIAPKRADVTPSFESQSRAPLLPLQSFLTFSRLPKDQAACGNFRFHFWAHPVTSPRTLIKSALKWEPSGLHSTRPVLSLQQHNTRAPSEER